MYVGPDCPMCSMERSNTVKPMVPSDSNDANDREAIRPLMRPRRTIGTDTFYSRKAT